MSPPAAGPLHGCTVHSYVRLLPSTHVLPRKPGLFFVPGDPTTPLLFACAAPEEGAKKPRKARKPKDPNAPKRATTAFFYFSQDHRAVSWRVVDGCACAHGALRLGLLVAPGGMLLRRTVLGLYPSRLCIVSECTALPASSCAAAHQGGQPGHWRGGCGQGGPSLWGELLLRMVLRLSGRNQTAGEPRLAALLNHSGSPLGLCPSSEPWQQHVF